MVRISQDKDKQEVGQVDSLFQYYEGYVLKPKPLKTGEVLKEESTKPPKTGEEESPKVFTVYARKSDKDNFVLEEKVPKDQIFYDKKSEKDNFVEKAFSKDHFFQEGSVDGEVFIPDQTNKEKYASSIIVKV
jgi:hypothetical protein